MYVKGSWSPDDRRKSLQDEQMSTQKKTFTNWANAYLCKAGFWIKDLFTDLADGKLLMKLLEIIYNERIGPPNRGLMRVQKMENVDRCLRFLHSKMYIENIGAEDIVDGNPCLILGLIWTIIIRFDIEEIGIENDEESTEKKSAKDALLLWCQQKTEGYQGVNIQNFSMSWKNGLGFNALIHTYRPDLIDYDLLRPENHINNLTNAFQVASSELGIPQILDAEDVDVEKPDEKSILTYLASYYHYFAKMDMEIAGSNRKETANMESENCSICNNEDSVAVQWCPHCLKCLCSSCEEQHKSLCGENATIPYEDYRTLPPFMLRVDFKCQKHNEKFKYFCRTHDVPCCEKCLSELHKKCDNTPVIDEIIRNVKSSAGFEDVWNDLEETHDTFKIAIERRENNLLQMETIKKEFAKQVKGRTNKLIDQLRTIEHQTLSAFDLVVRETGEKIKKANETLRSNESKLKTMIGHKTSLKKNASDYQVFIGIKHIENEVKESQECLQKECSGGDLLEWELEIENFDLIEDVIAGINTFGNVKMHMKQTKHPLKKTLPNRAQMMVEREFPPKLQLKQQIALEEGNYSGCCLLPNGRMAFADLYKDEIKITENDGPIRCQIWQ